MINAGKVNDLAASHSLHSPRPQIQRESVHLGADFPFPSTPRGGSVGFRGFRPSVSQFIQLLPFIIIPFVQFLHNGTRPPLKNRPAVLRNQQPRRSADQSIREGERPGQQLGRVVVFFGDVSRADGRMDVDKWWRMCREEQWWSVVGQRNNGNGGWTKTRVIALFA